MLSLPSESYLAEQMEVADIDGIHGARQRLRHTLASALRDELRAVYQRCHEPGPHRIGADAAARRALKNVCLSYLMVLDDSQSLALCLDQIANATNMTDELGALAALINRADPERDQALANFYQRWQSDPLVVDKWFSLQASSTLPDTLDRVKALMQHDAFTLKNPNKVRALIGAFSRANPVRFHAPDGSGYVFIADQVLALNALNPQIAARLLGAFGRWRKLDGNRQTSIRGQLERILAVPDLSADVYEIASKSLNN